MQPKKNLSHPVASWMHFLLLFIMVGYLSRPFLAFSQGGEPVATLGNVLGKVQVIRGTQVLEAKKGLSVLASDKLETQAKSAVKIQFLDGGSIVAFEGTTLTIQEYKVQKESGGSGESTVKSSMDLAKGKIRFFIKPNQAGKNDVKFKTSSAVMGIRGTSGAIAVEGGKTTAGLFTGKAEFVNPAGAKVGIIANQQVSVSATDKMIKVEPLSTNLKNLDTQSKQVDPSVGQDSGNKQEGNKSPEKKEEKPSENNNKSDSKEGPKSKENDPKSAPSSEPKTDPKADPKSDPKSTGSTSPSSAPKTVEPEPVPVKVDKKVVFGADGKQSLVIKSDDLNSVLKNQLKDSAAPVLPPAAVSVEPANIINATREIEKVTSTTNEVKELVEDVSETTKAIDKAVTDTKESAPIPLPKTKNIEIVIELPKAP